MGTYDRLQPGLFVMSQGERESKRHGHGPAPESKGETTTHAITMPPFYRVAQLKYTGTGFTKQTSRWLSWIAAITNTSGMTHHGATGFGSSLQMAGLNPSAACCRVSNATQASRQIAAHKNEALLCFLSKFLHRWS